MENKFLKIIESLKGIRPDQGFMEKSRREILAVSKNATPARFYLSQLKFNLREGFNFALALGMASILFYLVSFIAAPGQQPQIAEKASDEFSIQLKEATYYKEIAPNVVVVVLDKETFEKEFGSQ